MRFAQFAAREKITERNHCPGFPRAGRHHYQCFPVKVALKGFTDPANGARLVIPFNNCAVDLLPPPAFLRLSRRWINSSSSAFL